MIPDFSFQVRCNRCADVLWLAAEPMHPADFPMCTWCANEVHTALVQAALASDTDPDEWVDVECAECSVPIGACGPHETYPDWPMCSQHRLPNPDPATAVADPFPFVPDPCYCWACERERGALVTPPPLTVDDPAFTAHLLSVFVDRDGFDEDAAIARDQADWLAATAEQRAANLAFYAAANRRNRLTR